MAVLHHQRGINLPHCLYFGNSPFRKSDRMKYLVSTLTHTIAPCSYVFIFLLWCGASVDAVYRLEFIK